MAEGIGRCPAWRGLAYVVFEDLELSDFFNRIPALTFEVIADAGGFSLQDVVGELIADADAAVPLPGFVGLSGEGLAVRQPTRRAAPARSVDGPGTPFLRNLANCRRSGGTIWRFGC